MIPSLTYQMAQDRRAKALREAEEYRRAGRLTVLMRIRARIPRFPTGSRRSRDGVVGPSTPGLVKISDDGRTRRGPSVSTVTRPARSAGRVRS